MSYIYFLIVKKLIEYAPTYTVPCCNMHYAVLQQPPTTTIFSNAVE